MAVSRYHIKVLFSHPSDAKKYLPAVSNAFNKANDTFGELLSIHFNVYYWERDAYRCWGDAQLSIDDELVRTADIVIAVFESRLGTPVHSYESGTDEEIRVASNCGNKHIWVFFSEHGYAAAKPEEKERLQKYKEAIGKLCFYSDFLNDERLYDSLYQQISLYLRTYSNALNSEVDATSSATALSKTNSFIINGNTGKNQQFIQNATFFGGNFFGSNHDKGDK